MAATAILSLAVLTAIALAGSDGPARITVLKCCRDDEELSVPSSDDDDVARCLPSRSTWKPLIYSPAQKTMVSRPPSSWSILTDVRPNCSESSYLTYVAYSTLSPFIMLDVGNAILESGTGANLKPGEFCADSNALLACLPGAAATRLRVRRCCGAGAAFHEHKSTCVHVEERADAPALLPNAPSSLAVEIVPGFPSCRRLDNLTLIGDASEAAVLPDGGLRMNGAGLHLPSGRYCIERITGELVNGSSGAKVFACSEHAPRIPAVQESDIRFTLYPVGFLISIVFLAATLAAGWLLPMSHHVLHWRCQTHHVACLMLGDLLMVIIQLAGDSLRGGSCKALAIMAHFSFLAAFFWLNTMCFNIWWTFRDLRPASLEKGQERLRLRVYACYAWGGPLLIAGLAALLDHLPFQPQYTFLRPRFGERKCWFYGDMEILAYFFGPIGALLAVNLLFFAATARELTCGLWKGEFVKSNTERAALGRVCMKLVVVMGVTWVADVVSWAVGGPQYLWYFTDLLNALQGVFIFAVVGCQPQVWAALKRFCNRNPRTNAGRQGNALSTTSHGILITGDSVTQSASTKTVPLETIC